MARRLPRVYSTIRLKTWLNEESKLFRILALRGLRNLVGHREMVKGPLTTHFLAKNRTTRNIFKKLREEDLGSVEQGECGRLLFTVYPLVPF